MKFLANFRYNARNNWKQFGVHHRNTGPFDLGERMRACYPLPTLMENLAMHFHKIFSEVDHNSIELLVRARC